MASDKINELFESWSRDRNSRIPSWVYTDRDIYLRELEKLFYQGHWCYVGLEAEIPEPGDFKRTGIGGRSVVMTRSRDNSISVVENVCAHRGMQFCRERSGNRAKLICPYHQWSYDLKGNLQGVPLRHGVEAADGTIQGGMPEDFRPEDHNLKKLKVAVRNGVVFASFDHNIESFEDFLGPKILALFDRTFNGRKLEILGYNRQRIPGNWKLMQENIKDPYHPGLLHVWFVTFGLWRADNKSQLVMDEHFRHAAMISEKGSEGKKSTVTEGVGSFREGMRLNDDRFLDVVIEPWWKGPTVVMMTLFPSVIIQQQVNSLSTRHIIPRSPDSFDFVWTHFCFEDDDPEMKRRRLRQANLFGPAGFVSADDGEVIEFSQDGFLQAPEFNSYAALGGEDLGDTDHMVSETLIRSMYSYWRNVMEANE
jgi:salicylate 5-hydroxylase large subunit